MKSALENIDVLRSQFTNETKDFEGYVDHITKLSDEREARAAECEAENVILKEQLELLRLQLASKLAFVVIHAACCKATDLCCTVSFHSKFIGCKVCKTVMGLPPRYRKTGGCQF